MKKFYHLDSNFGVLSKGHTFQGWMDQTRPELVWCEQNLVHA